jgi:hypothetical protein
VGPYTVCRKLPIQNGIVISQQPGNARYRV